MTTDPRDQRPDAQSEPTLESELESVHSAWSSMDAPEPPELIDQAVLNRARRALQPRAGRRRFGWIGAFATTAVVVVALSLVVHQDPQPIATPTTENGVLLDHAPAPAEADPDAMERESGRTADTAGRLDENRKLEKQSEPSAAGAAFSDAPDETLMRSELPETGETARLAVSAPSEKEDRSRLAEEQPTKGLSETEQWVQQLMNLKEERKFRQLAEELAAFREAHPDYPLPIELLD